MGKSYYYQRGKLVETITHKKAKDIKDYCNTCKKQTSFRLFGISNKDGELWICNKCEQFKDEVEALA